MPEMESKEKLMRDCVTQYCIEREGSILLNCSGAGVIAECEETYAEAMAYLKECREDGISPTKRFEPQNETPVLDLRDYLHQIDREIDALRPAFGDLDALIALEMECKDAQKVVNYILFGAGEE